MTNKLTQKQYLILYKSSYITLFGIFSAIYNKYYDLALTDIIIFITSINYWTNPNIILNRNIDISCVNIFILYQLIRAYEAEYVIQSYICVAISLIFYRISCKLSNRHLHWQATYAHIMVHIFMNMGSIILHSGHIVPIQYNKIVLYLK